MISGQAGCHREEHGPDSVGFYLGTGMAYDIAGWHTAERLIGGLRTHQRYTR